MKIKVTQTDETNATKQVYYDGIDKVIEEKGIFTLISGTEKTVFIDTKRTQHKWEIIEGNDKKWETIRINEIILKKQIEQLKDEIKEIIEEHKKAKEYYERELKKAEKEENEINGYWYTAKAICTTYIINELENMLEKI